MTRHAVTSLPVVNASGRIGGTPTDDAMTAVQLMTSTRANGLPVIDDQQRVVGVISRSDVVRALARADTEIVQAVTEPLTDVGHDDWSVQVRDGTVEVTGPHASTDRVLAGAAASTVTGVMEVRVR